MNGIRQGLREDRGDRRMREARGHQCHGAGVGTYDGGHAGNEEEEECKLHFKGVEDEFDDAKMLMLKIYC